MWCDVSYMSNVISVLFCHLFPMCYTYSLCPMLCACFLCHMCQMWCTCYLCHMCSMCCTFPICHKCSMLFACFLYQMCLMCRTCPLCHMCPTWFAGCKRCPRNAQIGRARFFKEGFPFVKHIHKPTVQPIIAPWATALVLIPLTLSGIAGASPMLAIKKIDTQMWQNRLAMNCYDYLKIF